MWTILKAAGSFLIRAFTGGSLDSILSTINKQMDSDVEKEKVKADVTKKWVDAQVNLLVGRTWWFQLFFVIPAGVYWAALLFVSAFPMFGWTVHRMPGFAEEIYFAIVSALFIVDGGKALLGRFGK